MATLLGAQVDHPMADAPDQDQEVSNQVHYLSVHENLIDRYGKKQRKKTTRRPTAKGPLP